MFVFNVIFFFIPWECMKTWPTVFHHSARDKQESRGVWGHAMLNWREGVERCMLTLGYASNRGTWHSQVRRRATRVIMRGPRGLRCSKNGVEWWRKRECIWHISCWKKQGREENECCFEMLKHMNKASVCLCRGSCVIRKAATLSSRRQRGEGGSLDASGWGRGHPNTRHARPRCVTREAGAARRTLPHDTH